MNPQFGLIGKKLGHSFSKKYFTEKFEKQGIEAAYELYELPDISEFTQLIERVPNLKGLNVTIPYKAEVIPFLDILGEESQAIEAVNTISVRDGKLIGNNSDIFGFWSSLQEFMGRQTIKAAIILGTGGASRAVEYVLKEKMKVSEYLFVSRFPSKENCISYDDLQHLDTENFNLIINTTPLGMYPYVDNCPNFPYSKLTDQHYAIDLIYNPEETLFLRRSKERGANTENGMPMLIGQAEKSWEIWNR